MWEAILILAAKIIPFFASRSEKKKRMQKLFLRYVAKFDERMLEAPRLRVQFKDVVEELKDEIAKEKAEKEKAEKEG